MIHTIVYTYNVDGVRVGTAADDSETRYVQDVIGLPQVLVELTGEGSTLYLYGLGRLTEVQGADAKWFFADAPGSVRQTTEALQGMVDDDGAVTLARDYSPFGLLRAEAGTGDSGYGLTGEQVGPLAMLANLAFLST